MDAVTGRRNTRREDLSTPVGKIFIDAMSCKYHVAVSRLTIEELYGISDSSKLGILFKIVIVVLFSKDNHRIYLSPSNNERKKSPTILKTIIPFSPCNYVVEYFDVEEFPCLEKPFRNPFVFL